MHYLPRRFYPKQPRGYARDVILRFPYILVCKTKDPSGVTMFDARDIN